MKAYPYNPQFNLEHGGMDLLDYFASKVAQAILTGSAWNITNPHEVARKAYEYADVMMEIRNAD